MIAHSDIRARAQEWSLREDVVEKDYVLGWLLWGIGTDPTLRDEWVFKGGTCLKKCYFETFRFSEDLDFTLTSETLADESAVREALRALLPRIERESGIALSHREPRLRRRPNGSLEGRVYYRGPRNAPTLASIRLDLTAGESIVQPTVPRPIRHLFPDKLPEPATVRCYSLDEVFAEKLRAMAERGRPRDLYDITFLFRQPALGRHSSQVYEVLVAKCQAKSVDVPTLGTLAAASTRLELESEWVNMLGHQLPHLAPLEHYWDQLGALFQWLEGREAMPQLSPAPGVDESLWEPSPERWTWGAGPALEPLRFAGANRLCVDLGYQGGTRRIEPYSLRTTREGHLLLHAVRVEDRQHRSYRVDRIQSIEVTSQPFSPVYLVELSLGDPVRAPRQTRPRGAGSTAMPFRVRCPRCGKVFPRKRRTARLYPHKTPSGRPCPARSGQVL